MARPSRILVIEDDADTRDLIVEELRDHGLAVETAPDGGAGIAMIETAPPDLVLCDITMPGMTGYEVLERLTALHPRYGDLPFVFLTALGSREDMLRGRRLGADDYLTKPIDFDLLVEVVKARLVRVARALNKPAPALTEREAEALAWVARGKSSADTAVLMGISERTVNFHVENAMAKLGVATRVQAVLAAGRAGLIRA
ncbi:MAG TPA: response regulator transcription factor [Alphaproteobacteria bacterium]|nr:response regulator transcription factor [Alphaproteobacteria bacterium]